MATLTFYRAVDSQTDGSKGDQIVSGQIGVILPEVTSDDLITGVTQLEKFYIEIGETKEIPVVLETKGMFEARLMVSDSDSEVASDVPSTRKRYRSALILSNDTQSVTINETDNQDFAVDDYVLVGANSMRIDSITTSNGETTLHFAKAMPNVNYAGTYASNVIKRNFTAGVALPFWVENIIEAGDPVTADKNILPVLVGGM